MSGSQEKTEKPTAKKITDARSRGQVAKSRDLNTIVVLAGGMSAIYLSSGLILHHFKALLAQLWGNGFSLAVNFSPDVNLLLTVISHFALMVAPTVLVISVLAIAISLFQTNGFLLSLEAIKPDLAKLNPLKGFQRFFSIRSSVELVKSLIKISVIAYIVYTVCDSEKYLLSRLAGVEVVELLQVYGHLALKVLIRVGVVMTLFAILDYYYQRWQYERDLKMTKQEVKEERKESEGNPQIKGRIRSIQRSLAQKRMMADVPKASVVITNPTHFAVALIYSSQMEAPKMVAKGADFLAQKIIKIARQHNVPVVSNPPLARALYSKVKVDEFIPITLYKAVAKVLAYIFQRKGHKPS